MFNDWILAYDGVAYPFGPNDRDVKVRRWQFAGVTYRTDDAVLPRQDGVGFGEDFIEPGELAIDIIIDYSSRPEPASVRADMAWETRSEFERIWRADPVRGKSRAVAELTIGGAFMLEGRPRRIMWDDDAQNVGVIKGTAYFVQAGYGIYDVSDGANGWHERTLLLTPAQIGGLKAPLKAPLRTSMTSTRATSFEVGGKIPAWGIYELHGPIQSDAQIEVPGRWRIYLNRSLGEHQVATIDTRPGHLATYLNGVARQLLDPRSSMLKSCSLLPGQNVVALRGASIEGTASVTVRWRNMKASI